MEGLKNAIELPGCPYGSIMAIAKVKDLPSGATVRFVTDDKECVDVLRRLLPIVDARVERVEAEGNRYVMYVHKA